MSPLIASFTRPSAGQPSRAALLVRIAVGFVFLTSGALKFLFENQGQGRFTKLGLPAPMELAHFVGTVEVLGGLMILIGLFTRLAAIPLVIDMLVAIATTKIPLLLGAGPEPLSAMPKTGLWAFAYQSRLDITMLCACVYLAAAGAGLWSLDARIARRRGAEKLVEAARREAHA